VPADDELVISGRNGTNSVVEAPRRGSQSAQKDARTVYCVSEPEVQRHSSPLAMQLEYNLFESPCISVCSNFSADSVATCSTFSTIESFDLENQFLNTSCDTVGITSLSDQIPNRPSTASSPRLLLQDVKSFGPPYDNAGSGEGIAKDSLSPSKVDTELLPHLVDKVDSNLEPLKLEIYSRPENPSVITTQQVHGSCSEDVSLTERIDSTPSPGKNSTTLSPCTSTERLESPPSRCEEDTDWEESDSSYSDRSGVFAALDYARKYHDDDFSSAPVKPLLTPAKQRLVDHLMQEFWILFDQDWMGNVRSCAGSESVSESGRASISDGTSNSRQEQSSSSPSIQSAGKRSGEQGQEEDQDPDDRDPPGPKRLKKDVENLDKANCKFACPYRKSNPRKYCIQGIWRSCALTPLESIARVKYEHLFDMNIQCTTNSGAEPICTDTIAYSNAGDAKHSLTARTKLMSICRLLKAVI
jgi:hypothetical protein